MAANKHSATVTSLILRIHFPFLIKRRARVLTQGRLEII
jgi:hypothetical protein